MLTYTIARRVAVLLLATTAGLAHAQAPADPFNYSRSSSFTYRADGLLESETIEPDAANAALCVTTVHHYDAFGNKDSVTTSNCTTGTVPARQQFAARTSSTAYSLATMPVVSVFGTNVTLTPGAFPLTATNAEGHSESRLYDPRFGAVTRLTGPNQLPTTWALDDFGRKVKETRPDGTSTVVAYCFLAGRVSDITSNSADCPTPPAAEVPADAVSFTHTEPRDTANAKMGPYSRAYSDRLGRVIRTATEGFDGAGQPAAQKATPVVADTVYNAFGAQVIQTQPYFLATGSSTAGTATNDRGATRTDFDVLGRPTAVYTTDPDGSQASVDFGAYGVRRAARATFVYDGLTSTTYNDKGQSRREEKNANGQLVRITDSVGGRLVHQHDAFGNLRLTVDALGNRIALTHDLRGRKTELNDPDAGVTRYDYNPLGELVWQQTANQRAATVAAAQQTTLRYDRLGRMVERIEPEYTTTWTYDKYPDNSACARGTGKLCAVATSHGVARRYVFDDLGRPLNARTTISGAVGTGPNFASALSYDTVTGRVAGQTYPTGLRVGYSYTARGFLEKVLLATAATVAPLPATAGGTPGAATSLAANSLLWQAQAVNAWGKAERQTHGNNVNTQAVFDAASGRTTSLKAGLGTATNVLNHTYAWDSLDNLLQRNDANGDAVAGAVSESFRYEDGLNRLTGYTVSAPAVPGTSRSVTLQYNVLGQLLYKSDVGVYGYGPAGPSAVRPHALQSVTDSAGAATTYGYDANGNLVSASAGKYRSITYTSFNLPDSNTGAAGAGGSPRYTWHYDEGHARVKEVRVDSTGTRTTWYLHPDNAGGLSFESETSPGGAISNRHYISAGGQAIGVLVSSGALPTLAATQTAPPVITTLALVKVEYWHKDHLGSLAATTDHLGAVTGRYAYDPFGKRRYTNGNYDAAGNLVVDWSAAVNSGTDRGFTGHEHLDDIGLVHMNGRLFDPRLGVFLQADPLIQAPDDLQNYNRYGYCLNNPLTCTDPTGHFSLKRMINKAINKVLRFGYELSGLRMLGLSFENYRIASSIAAAVVLGPAGAGAATGWGAIGQAATAGFVSGTIATGTIEGGIQGAFSSAMFYGAGNVIGGGNFFTGGVSKAAAWGSTASVALHGVVGCVTSVAGGGKCGPGALSAAFTKAAGVNGLVPNDKIGGTIMSAVIGGTASVLGGGKFANGAQTGAFSYLFNQVAHQGLEVGGSRGLTTGEITLAREVFGDDIQYDQVKLFRQKAYFFQSPDTTMAPDGNIYFHPDATHYRDDFSTAEIYLQAHFIHEMTHVLQSQSGIDVRTAAFNRTYNYVLEPGKPFSAYGLEQQGNITRDYFYLKNGYTPPKNPGTLSQYEALKPFRP